jgi:hypothetical protein
MIFVLLHSMMCLQAVPLVEQEEPGYTDEFTSYTCASTPEHEESLRIYQWGAVNRRICRAKCKDRLWSLWFP